MGGHSLDIVIAEAAKDLYQPAGSSPHFSSLERIRKYRREYVVECHKTWKKWQEKAIHEILVFEAFARREKTHPIGPTAAEWADYNQAVWRRVNDSIIWC